MSKCPYCKVDLRIEDFYAVYKEENKKEILKIARRDFRGEHIESRGYDAKMWACPECDMILGFSEYAYSS